MPGKPCPSMHGTRKVMNWDWAGTNQARVRSSWDESGKYRDETGARRSLATAQPLLPQNQNSNHFMSTATTTSHDTGQHVSPRGRQREAQQSVTQQERSAANRLRATMAAVKLSFTWLGVRKTLAPEQRLVPRVRAYLDVIREVV